MFCKNCGKEIDNKAIACPNCGVGTGLYAEPTEEKSNVLAIVGFVLSFFIAIAGLICSIIGYKNAPQYSGKGKGLALAGIIISAVSMAIVFIYVFIVLAALIALI